VLEADHFGVPVSAVESASAELNEFIVAQQ
jgi:hypothetical protein